MLREMKYRKLRKVLLKWGVEIGKGTGGSHVKFKYPGARRHFSLVLSKGQKSDVTEKYVRALCRNFGFDFEEFWADCNPSKASRAKASKALEVAQPVEAAAVQTSADQEQVAAEPGLLDEEVSDPDSNAA